MRKKSPRCDISSKLLARELRSLASRDILSTPGRLSSLPRLRPEMASSAASWPAATLEALRRLSLRLLLRSSRWALTITRWLKVPQDCPSPPLIPAHSSSSNSSNNNSSLSSSRRIRPTPPTPCLSLRRARPRLVPAGEPWPVLRVPSGLLPPRSTPPCRIPAMLSPRK